MENPDALGKENNAGVVYLALELSRKKLPHLPQFRSSARNLVHTRRLGARGSCFIATETDGSRSSPRDRTALGPAKTLCLNRSEALGSETCLVRTYVPLHFVANRVEIPLGPAP